MTDHCSECELELTNGCPKYGGKVKCDSLKEACKGLGYDMHTDACYTQPECPECGYPLFIEEKDIGNTVKCTCGASLHIPDTDWIRKYVDNFTGQKEIEWPCMNDKCDGTMKVLKVKRNGNWVTAGGQCEKCGMRFIV